MKLNATIVAAGWLLAGATALLWPATRSRTVATAGAPARAVVPGRGGISRPDERREFREAPPCPPLPYGFTWDGYYGAEVEHDVYGYRRLNPPPRKTVSCYGLFVGLADSVHVMFSYPYAEPAASHVLSEEWRRAVRAWEILVWHADKLWQRLQWRPCLPVAAGGRCL